MSPQFITNTDTIPFPQPNGTVTAIAATTAAGQHELSPSKQKQNAQPISFALTDFHILLLYTDHVTAISLLNYQTVYEEYFTEQYGRLGDIITDSRSNTIFVHSSKSIFRYRVTNEARNVWRMYLDKNDFDMARIHSRDNPAHLDVVLVKQAELCFSNREYMRSAEIFSETQSSFETVCLRFLAVDEKQALMMFLCARLDALKSTDKTQITMLVVWMVELYLTEMAHCADEPSKYRALQKELDQFMNLSRVIECIRSNRTVIYDLFASHGDTLNLTSLTTSNRDFESVVNQYINQECYGDALSVLTSQNRPELYYKYCPILMEEIPRETTSALIAVGKPLDPIKLLPTLICVESGTHVTEVIKYLEFCVHSLACTEQAIHNFLVKMYCQHGMAAGDVQHISRNQKLMSYLETEGKDVSMVHYDVHYALRYVVCVCICYILFVVGYIGIRIGF